MTRFTLLCALVVALATCVTAQALGDCVSSGTLSRCFGVFLTDLQFDPLNCGRCGKVCTPGLRCCNGQCQDCSAGLFKCTDNVCRDLQIDPQNCGRCGAACPAGAQCINGACSCPPDTPTSCGGICTNTLTDPYHCGGCASACKSGYTCSGGDCVALPPSPPSAPAPPPAPPSPSPRSHAPPVTGCGSTGAVSNCFDEYFADFMVDARNCGGCNKLCALGINCCFGQCQDCPGESFKCQNNVCTDLQTDPQNCGRCGAACPAGAQCISGACSCPPDRPTTCGACTDTLTDNNHCGACNIGCVPGYSCVNGACTVDSSPEGPVPSPIEAPLTSEPAPTPASPSPSPSPASPSPSPLPSAVIPLGGGCSAACGPGFSCSNGRCVQAVTFNKPKMNGMRIDFCLAADRTQCGQPAADAYCQQEGFDEALAFKGPIKRAPTFFLGGQQSCTNDCATFHSIDCSKVAPA